MNTVSTVARQFIVGGFIVILSGTASPDVFAASLRDILVLREDGVIVRFAVEVATTDAERATGLMHRPSLAPRTGMLFDFEARIRIRMWMKNTLIPLDMLFIDDDGALVHVAANTVPHSTALIEAPTAARYVLEINGGETADLGIAAGDRVLLSR